MARGHRLNTSIVLAAVHGLSGLFRAVSAVEPSLFRPLPPLSPSLTSNLASVDVKQNALSLLPPPPPPPRVCIYIYKMTVLYMCVCVYIYIFCTVHKLYILIFVTSPALSQALVLRIIQRPCGWRFTYTRSQTRSVHRSRRNCGISK